jgi:pimeloyl-ACP methyl ester carboxylesterase
MRYLLGIALAASLSVSAAIAASVDGAKVHWSSFEDRKTGGKKTGDQNSKTVILVHGWTCDESTWESQVPVLSKTHRVITLDLPGHGKSDPPKDGKFTVDVFARAIEAVRTEAKAGRVVVVGHSLGAPVVRQYARLFPKQTVALVFVDGVIVKPTAIGRFNDNGVNSQGPNGPKFREQLIRSMFSISTTPDEQKHILSMMLSTPEPTAVGAAKSLADPSIWSEEPMRIPVLGLYADHGGRGDHTYLSQLFPVLEYHELPRTGHFLMLEKPAEFNALLLAFLDKQHYGSSSK